MEEKSFFSRKSMRRHQRESRKSNRGFPLNTISPGPWRKTSQIFFQLRSQKNLSDVLSHRCTRRNMLSRRQDATVHIQHLTKGLIPHVFLSPLGLWRITFLFSSRSAAHRRTLVHCATFCLVRWICCARLCVPVNRAQAQKDSLLGIVLVNLIGPRWINHINLHCQDSLNFDCWVQDFEASCEGILNESCGCVPQEARRAILRGFALHKCANWNLFQSAVCSEKACREELVPLSGGFFSPAALRAEFEQLDLRLSRLFKITQRNLKCWRPRKCCPCPLPNSKLCGSKDHLIKRSNGRATVRVSHSILSITSTCEHVKGFRSRWSALLPFFGTNFQTKPTDVLLAVISWGPRRTLGNGVSCTQRVNETRTKHSHEFRQGRVFSQKGEPRKLTKFCRKKWTKFLSLRDFHQHLFSREGCTSSSFSEHVQWFPSLSDWRYLDAGNSDSARGLFITKFGRNWPSRELNKMRATLKAWADKGLLSSCDDYHWRLLRLGCQSLCCYCVLLCRKLPLLSKHDNIPLWMYSCAGFKCWKTCVTSTSHWNRHFQVALSSGLELSCFNNACISTRTSLATKNRMEERSGTCSAPNVYSLRFKTSFCAPLPKHTAQSLSFTCSDFFGTPHVRPWRSSHVCRWDERNAFRAFAYEDVIYKHQKGGKDILTSEL